MNERQQTPVWLWLNRLSLDAPVIAVVWLDFLARCYPSGLTPGGRLALGFSVWAIYLTDRLLDLRSSSEGAVTFAHNFGHRSRKLLGILLVVAFVGAVIVGLLWLRPAVFVNGLVVSVGVIAYLGLFSVKGLAVRWKPVAASILFAAGVFVVAWSGIPDAIATLAIPMAAFCLLCFANLMLINQWTQGESAARTAGWTVLLVVGCVLMSRANWYSAVALAGSGLVLLGFFGHRLSLPARRVLADAVLLAPLLFL
jgi:hypothetical protein